MAKTALTRRNNKSVSLDKYEGQWIAFVDGQVVESDRSLPRLMQKIKKIKSAKKPSVMLVPRKDEGPYVLIL